ncbi:MAG: hypothetical protein V1834_02225 [Candidatus Micrarchaeota archaeon]
MSQLFWVGFLGGVTTILSFLVLWSYFSSARFLADRPRQTFLLFGTAFVFFAFQNLSMVINIDQAGSELRLLVAAAAFVGTLVFYVGTTNLIDALQLGKKRK